MDKGIDGLTC